MPHFFPRCPPIFPLTVHASAGAARQTLQSPTGPTPLFRKRRPPPRKITRPTFISRKDGQENIFRVCIYSGMHLASSCPTHIHAHPPPGNPPFFGTMILWSRISPLSLWPSNPCILPRPLGDRTFQSLGEGWTGGRDQTHNDTQCFRNRFAE